MVRRIPCTLRVPGLILGASLAWAAPHAWATAPPADDAGHEAREPAAKAPDLSSPRSAAAAWLQSAAVGDVDTALKIVVDDKEHRQFVVDMLTFSAALRGLRDAAVAAFGEAGREVTARYEGLLTPPHAKLHIEVDGDTATVTMDEAINPLRLRKVDADWRVDLDASVRDVNTEKVARGARRAAAVADQVAAEIGEGKFKSADAAREAFARRQLAAVRDEREDEPRDTPGSPREGIPDKSDASQ
jgi:hypothetical protein